ncbi:hypothetical protein ACJRO7_014668 [Eucalyptus globulus]|uniref:Uncharacterized protein n=1 Tax=Eucalyptus globulus TaxID=34317 RepID=A0ABD3L6S8_EUCGL
MLRLKMKFLKSLKNQGKSAEKSSQPSKKKAGTKAPLKRRIGESDEEEIPEKVDFSVEEDHFGMAQYEDDEDADEKDEQKDEDEENDEKEEINEKNE